MHVLNLLMFLHEQSRKRLTLHWCDFINTYVEIYIIIVPKNSITSDIISNYCWLLVNTQGAKVDVIVFELRVNKKNPNLLSLLTHNHVSNVIGRIFLWGTLHDECYWQDIPVGNLAWWMLLAGYSCREPCMLNVIGRIFL